MTFTKINQLNRDGSLGITIPAETAKQLKWKAGHSLYVDWVAIAEDTIAISTSHSLPHTTDRRYEGEINGRTKTRGDIPSRISQSNSMGERSEQQGREADQDVLSEGNTLVQGQERQVDGDRELQPERPAEGSIGSSESIREADAQRTSRRINPLK